MKERPIIFSAPMIRALLDGRKSQTRRVVKPQPEFRHGCFFSPGDSTGYGPGLFTLHCKYGKPGDRLWVRETWQGPLWPDDDMYPENGYTTKYCEYNADGGSAPQYIDSDDNIREGWKASIHMPRWASRITLEITNVRVERLQDIEGQTAFESDALKEGVNAIHHGDGSYYYSAFHSEPHHTDWCDPTDAFRELWESINGASSWDANPWVWVIEFRRINP